MYNEKKAVNPRSAYDNELEALHRDLTQMGTLAEEAVEKAIEALKNEDKDLAKQVIKNDEAINTAEREIESKCLNLILRQQPIAGDLRSISTALKIITDIERIGDHGADIAEITLKMKDDNVFEELVYIPKMAKRAVTMVHQAIAAFVRSDTDMAKAVIAADDDVDQLFEKIKKELSRVFAEARDIHHRGIDLLMVAKYLERIADHTVNISEWVIFSVTGIHKDQQIM